MFAIPGFSFQEKKCAASRKFRTLLSLCGITQKNKKGTAGPTIPKMEKSGSYEEQRQLAPTSGHPSV